LTLLLYVLRLLSAAVAVSAGGMFFLAIPAIVVNAVHKLGGVNMGALLGFLPLVLVDLVPYLMPIGFLLALVATYGRLAADNEWTAICMAGVHPVRMLLPAFVVAAALGGVSHYLTTEVSPGLSFAKREYGRKVVIDGFRDVNPGRTEVKLGEFYMSAQYRDPQSNIFRDVTIHLPASTKRVEGASGEGLAGLTVLADVVEISFPGDRMRIHLTRARVADEGHHVRVGHSVAEVDLDELLDLKPKDRLKWRYQTSRDLRGLLDRGEVEAKDVRAAVYELHARVTRTATYFLFILLGVPTGLLLRRGTQLGALAAAVGYALLYYLLAMRLGKTLAGWGTVSPVLAAWATTGIGTVAGLFLCWKALRR